MTVTVHVVLASFNRAATTRRCLELLNAQAGLGETFTLRATLVDASSSDSTVQHALAAFRGIEIVSVSTSTYWANAMSIGCAIAAQGRPDFLLMLNDDVELRADAVKSLLSAPNARTSIVVGALSDLDGALTYSGMARGSWRPTDLVKLTPKEIYASVDTFNGNVVLISSSAYARVGPIDGGYGHAFADLDYGLRARGLGVPMWLTPSFVGICSLNSAANTWRDPALGKVERIRLLMSVKGLPFKPLLRYTRRHSGTMRGTLLACAIYGKSIATVFG